MKCSSCGQGQLEASFLENLFACHSCNHCGGDLILLGDYMRWQQLNPSLETSSDGSAEIVTEDTSKAMICPLSGTLMTKYRISAGTDHRLDLSPTINAVWLDKGEWNLLKEEGLANQLNTIFTNHWQREIRATESAEVMKELYSEKFGDDYAAIKAFKEIVDSSNNRSEIIAYLLADDPYGQ